MKVRTHHGWSSAGLSASLAFAFALGSVACGGSSSSSDAGGSADAALAGDGGLADAGLADAATYHVLHTTAMPLAKGGGDLTFASATLALEATAVGIAALDLSGTGSVARAPAGWHSWALTSTGSGPAASEITVVSDPGSGSTKAFFLSTGRGQVGVIEVGSATQGALQTEAALPAPLSSAYPTALVRPPMGAGSDALWVVDAVFGPGGSVRAFPVAGYDSTRHQFSEDTHRTVKPQATDLGAGTPATLVLGRLVFRPEGDIGLVTFTVASSSTAPGATGGVLAFDAATGQLLGRLVVPLVSTASTSVGYVSDVGIHDDLLAVASAEKNSSTYADVGGQVAVYRVTSWRPFQVADADPRKRYDQPWVQLSTSEANALGVTVVGDDALVVAAPLSGVGGQPPQAVIDVVALDDSPRIRQSLPIGDPYLMMLFEPTRLRLSPDGSQGLLGTEAGVVEVQLR
jgi:hypothetical protein